MSKRIINSKIQFFPIEFFLITLGLAAFCLTIIHAEMHPALPDVFFIELSTYFAWFVLFVFVVSCFFWLIKSTKHPRYALKEFKNYQTTDLYAIMPLSFVLLAECFFEINIKFAEILWLTGAVLQLVFSVSVVNRWFHKQNLTTNDITPFWLIPTVGNLLIPIMGVQFASLAFSWMFFSVGLFFSFVVFILVIFRLIFEKPLGKQLQPSIFFILAPFSSAFVAKITLAPELDFLAVFLYYNAVFIFLLLLVELPNFFQQSFKLSNWSYIFPIATLCIANFKMHELGDVIFIGIFTWILEILLALMVCWAILQTVFLIINNKICITPEPNNNKFYLKNND